MLRTGDVQPSECIISKEKDAIVFDKGKGKHTCFPNWHDWHKLWLLLSLHGIKFWETKWLKAA